MGHFLRILQSKMIIINGNSLSGEGFKLSLSQSLLKRTANLLIFLMIITNPAGAAAVYAADAAQQEAAIVTVDKTAGQAVTLDATDSHSEKDRETNKEKAIQFGNRLLNYYLNEGKNNGPAWLKTTDFEINFSEHSSPDYSFETVRPLEKITPNGQQWFWQGRYARESDSSTANLGVGWRKLAKDKSSLIGVNMFYDYGFEYNLSRIGLGTEYFNKLAEYRANWYYPLSGDRQTGVDYRTTGILYSYIRAVEGGDFEAGTSFANAPWLKVFAGGYYWDNKHQNDEKGYRLRNTMQLTPRLNMELGYTHSNLSSSFYGNMKYQMAFGGGKSLKDDAKTENNKPETDLSGKLLQRVERENDIKTETWTKFVAYTGNIKVTVTNSHNHANTPIAGASVQAYQNGQAVGTAVTTDVSGRAVISGLAMGAPYTVYATYAGETGPSIPVTVIKDSEVTAGVSLDIAGGSATVTVVNAASAPVGGATVTATLNGTITTAMATKGILDTLLGVKSAYAGSSSFSVTSTTDTNGVAAFTNLPPGDYTFTATGSGHSMTSEAVNVASGRTSVEMIMLPTSGGNIKVTVKDGSGALLSGATVAVLSGMSTVASEITGSDGIAIFSGLTDGTYTLVASKSGYDSNTASANVTSGNTASSTISLVNSTGNVAVTVLTSDGSTVSPTFKVDGVSVTAVKSGNLYTISNISVGGHTITVSASNYNDATVTANVASGGTDNQSVTLTPQSCTVNITVLNGAGISPSFTEGGAPLAPKSVSGNVYTFKLLPGVHTIKVSAANYNDSIVTTPSVANGGSYSEAVTLVRQTGTVNITVTNGAGVNPSFTENGAPVTPTVNGNVYTFTVTSGVAHTIKVSAANYNDAMVTVNVASGGTDNQSVTLTVQTGSVTILVKDSSTNVAISGAAVTLNGVTQQTWSDGKTTFSNVPTGTYSYAVTATGYHDSTTGNSVIISTTSTTPISPTVKLVRQTGSVSLSLKGQANDSDVTVTLTNTVDATITYSSTLKVTAPTNTINSVPVGTYNVSVIAPYGYSAVANPTSIQVSDGQSTQVDINSQKLTYKIKATAGQNGSISPAGETIVTYDSSQSYTMTPAPGYRVCLLTIDGVSQICGSSAGDPVTYTFSGVTANRTIDVQFTQKDYSYLKVINQTDGVYTIATNNLVYTLPSRGTIVIWAPANSYWTARNARGYEVSHGLVRNAIMNFT